MEGEYVSNEATFPHGYFTGRYDLTPLPTAHWWSRTRYEFRLPSSDPLTYRRGTIAAQPDRHFISDAGSIPWLVQAIPALQKDRYWRAYGFHDSAYRNHCWYVRSRGDHAFQRRALTRGQADLWLREMLLAEGASEVTALVVYRAVRLCGWIAW